MSSEPTARPCPFCGLAVVGTHEGCTGLFKEIMSTPASSTLDEMPPEVSAVKADETRRLHDYILVEQIGKGGMGTVWKAWDLKLTRWVAVKFLNGQDSDDFARFTREAKLAARLRHPNIAAVFDTGEVPSKQAGQDAVRYLAMEFIEGQSVATAELPLPKWLDIFGRVARALDHAHKGGVIHRDIKPTNLMLTRENWPYVMDFGLAKSIKAGSSVSMSGVVLGTPSFMPPEQAGGRTREIDPRSDIYSLGATLYFVLTRQAPFQGEDSIDVIVKVLQTNPPRPREIDPEIPEAVEAVILKAMARDQDRRYATAGEMAEDLEKLAAGGTPALQPRSRAPAVAVVLLSLAVLLLLGWVLRKPEPPRLQSQAPLEKPSPMLAFLNELGGLKKAKKWQAALALVQEADFLKPEEKSGYKQEIETGCRDQLQKATAEFCDGVLMDRLRSPEPGFKFVSLDDLLPRPDQLLPNAAYDWTRSLLPKLDAWQSDALLQAAEKAVDLDEPGANPWFRAAELAAYRALLEELRSQTMRARGGNRDRVAECRAAAEALAKRWDEFLARLPAPFRTRQTALENHNAAVETARNDFPVDPEYLKSLDLAKILNAPDAEQRLDEVTQKLRALHGVGNLTLESQHSLLVNLVTARALAGAFQGTAPDQIADALKEFAEPLKRAGVDGNERSRFGPKVAAVFDRLLR